MPTEPIVLIESDYETVDDEIAAKEAQAAQLDAQGIPFQQHTLYRATDGARIFLITPIDPELESDEPRTRRTTPQKQRDCSQQVDYR